MTNSENPYPSHAQQQGAPVAVEMKGNNGLATAGFVLGLLGLLGSWIPVLNFVGIVLAIVGLILAGIGLSRSRKVNAGKGLAIAGLILGALAIVIALVINVAFVGAVDDAVDEVTDTSVQAPADEADTAAEEGSKQSSKDERGTTRDNPAPLGSAVTGGDWTVKVNSVKQIEKDSFGSSAAKGSILLLVNVTATYNGDDEQGETAWASVKFAGKDGTTVDSTDGSTLFVPEDGFDSLKTIYDGASVKGDQILEVPAENWEQGVLVVSPDLMSDDTFISLK